MAVSFNLKCMFLLLLNVIFFCAPAIANPILTKAVEALAQPVSASPGTKSTTIAPSRPSTTCSYIAKSPAPIHNYCGVQGKLHKPGVALSSHPGNTVAQCLTHCLAAGSNDCRAFGLDLTIKTCILYNQSASSQDFQASYSNVWFWSRKCFEEQCTVIGGKNSSSSAGHTSIAPSPLPTSQLSTKSLSGTASLTASVPVMTVSKGPNTCVIPVPLSQRDCRVIRVGVSDVGSYVNYNLYFNGSGVTESLSNPGNRPGQLLPSFTDVIPSSHTACDAATICAGHAASLGIGGVYMSFDLHYDLRSCQWICVAFGGYNNNGTYFNVKDEMAFVTHGFAGIMK